MADNESAGREDLVQQTIERFWESFPPVWDRIRANVRSIASEQFNISVTQFQIMRLVRRGRSSVSDLAEAKQISRSAISQAVDGMVEIGLLDRHQNNEDRRCYELRLTEKGSHLLNDIFKQNRVWMSEKLGSMNPEEAQIMMQSLEMLKRSFL